MKTSRNPTVCCVEFCASLDLSIAPLQFTEHKNLMKSDESLQFTIAEHQILFFIHTPKNGIDRLQKICYRDALK